MLSLGQTLIVVIGRFYKCRFVASSFSFELGCVVPIQPLDAINFFMLLLLLLLLVLLLLFFFFFFFILSHTAYTAWGIKSNQ